MLVESFTTSQQVSNDATRRKQEQNRDHKANHKTEKCHVLQSTRKDTMKWMKDLCERRKENSH